MINGPSIYLFMWDRLINITINSQPNSIYIIDIKPISAIYSLNQHFLKNSQNILKIKKDADVIFSKNN